MQSAHDVLMSRGSSRQHKVLGVQLFAIEYMVIDQLGSDCHLRNLEMLGNDPLFFR